MTARRRHSPSFFAREPDGSVRLRIRFEGDEASLFEEAAGDTPVMVWLHRTLGEAARKQIKAARVNQPRVRPEESDDEG